MNEAVASRAQQVHVLRTSIHIPLDVSWTITNYALVCMHTRQLTKQQLMLRSKVDRVWSAYYKELQKHNAWTLRKLLNICWRLCVAELAVNRLLNLAYTLTLSAVAHCTSGCNCYRVSFLNSACCLPVMY